MFQRALVSILKNFIVVILRIKCEFAAQPSWGGDQRCRIRNRIRSQIPSRSQNFLKSLIRIRSRIRNKSFRIHNLEFRPRYPRHRENYGNRAHEVLKARFYPFIVKGLIDTNLVYSTNKLKISRGPNRSIIQEKCRGATAKLFYCKKLINFLLEYKM
jgi:hypothetical protein